MFRNDAECEKKTMISTCGHTRVVVPGNGVVTFYSFFFVLFFNSLIPKLCYLGLEGFHVGQMSGGGQDHAARRDVITDH